MAPHSNAQKRRTFHLSAHLEQVEEEQASPQQPALSRVQALQRLLTASPAATRVVKRDFSAEREEEFARDPTAPTIQGAVQAPLIGGDVGEILRRDGLEGYAGRGRATSLCDVLVWRAEHQPKGVAYSVADAKGKLAQKITYKKLHSLAMRVATKLLEKHRRRSHSARAVLSTEDEGDRVALVFSRHNPASMVHQLAVRVPPPRVRCVSPPTEAEACHGSHLGPIVVAC